MWMKYITQEGLITEILSLTLMRMKYQRVIQEYLVKSTNYEAPGYAGLPTVRCHARHWTERGRVARNQVTLETQL
jgi:hypothetical protein